MIAPILVLRPKAPRLGAAVALLAFLAWLVAIALGPAPDGGLPRPWLLLALLFGG